MIELKESLAAYLFDFQKSIKDCITQTEYKDDIAIYQRDYEFVQHLLDSLLIKNEPPDKIANTIIDTQTAKLITDYWRKGICGDIECKEYYKLCDKVKTLIAVYNP